LSSAGLTSALLRGAVPGQNKKNLRQEKKVGGPRKKGGTKPGWKLKVTPISGSAKRKLVSGEGKHEGHKTATNGKKQRTRRLQGERAVLKVTIRWRN